jgi:hypothetical protein
VLLLMVYLPGDRVEAGEEPVTFKAEMMWVMSDMRGMTGGWIAVGVLQTRHVQRWGRWQVWYSKRERYLTLVTSHMSHVTCTCVPTQLPPASTSVKAFDVISRHVVIRAASGSPPSFGLVCWAPEQP